MTISTPQDTVPFGTALQVRLQLKNKSGHKMASGEGCLAVLEVRDVQGHAIPKTARQLEFERAPHLRLIAVTVMPGKTQECSYVITDMFDISRPGRYTIQAERRDFDRGGPIVKSNVLNVTITASQAPPVEPLYPTFSIAISIPATTELMFSCRDPQATGEPH